MQKKNIRVHDNNFDRIVNYVVDKVEFDYENHSKNMSVLLCESFRLRTMSGQADIVIFKQGNNLIDIDIIACGGGEGLLNLNFGSEKSFVQSVEFVLREYAGNYNLQIETDDYNA